MSNEFYDSRLIEWLIFIATIFIGPAVQVYIQRYFFRYDKRIKKLEKKANQNEEEKTKEKIQLIKELEKRLIEGLDKQNEVHEKNIEKFKEKSCSNCWKLYEEIWPSKEKSEE